MVTATVPRPASAENVRQTPLFGFQGPGPDGFVALGTRPNSNLADWEDGLFLRVRAGRGAGKSKAGAYRLINYAQHWPNCFGVITAPLEDTWNKSTFPAIKKALKECGLREGKEWNYNFNRKELTFWNGATCVFISAEHPENLRGPDAAIVWLDEPRGISETAFLNAVAMLRQPGFPHQAWLTSTPAGKRHWMYVRFEEQDDSGFEDVPFGRYVTMQACSYDNPYAGEAAAIRAVRNLGGKVRRLTAEEIAAMPKWQRFRRWHFYNLSPMARQELEGEEVAIEGMVYDCWDAQLHVKPRSEWPTQPQDMARVYGGQDYGWRNPCTSVIVGMDDAERVYIMESYRRSHIGPDALAEVGKAQMRQYGVRLFLGDDTPGWIPQLRTNGLPIRRADKRRGSAIDPSSGIGACYIAISRTDNEGNQMFFVDPKCKEFIDDIENYVEEDGRDSKDPPERPKELHHDVMDAFRYAMMHMRRFLGHSKDAYTFRIESSPVRL